MRRSLATAAALILSGGSLLAQSNTTPANAADAAWGQIVLSAVNGTTSQFWFAVGVEKPRSYCVESGQEVNGSVPSQFVNSVLAVFAGDQTTLLTSNDEANINEPKSRGFSRACWISPASGGLNYVRLSPFNASNPSFVTLRFVETTLFCPWFFIAGDYNAFSLIQNTSGTDLPGVVVTWVGLNGTEAGTTTVSIPANGTVVLNARDFVNAATFSNGSITIAHTGSPQQLTASTTTLSGATGLGFDALFSQRQRF